MAVEPPLRGLNPEATVRLSLIDGRAEKGSEATGEDLFAWWKGLAPAGKALAALAAVTAAAAVVTLLLVLAALTNTL